MFSHFPLTKSIEIPSSRRQGLGLRNGHEERTVRVGVGVAGWGLATGEGVGGADALNTKQCTHGKVTHTL